MTFSLTTTDDHIRRSHYMGGRRPRIRIRPERYFIGWDGEGYTDAPSGGHHYMLFGNSVGGRVQHPNMRHRQAFELLLNTAKDHPNAIHVIFAGQYDAIMWFHQMPSDIVKRIMDGKPTRYDGYRIHYFRGKYLRLSSWEPRRTITLYDVFSFFATSFVKACREYLGNDETLDHIAEMKLLRSTFDREAMPEVDRYMTFELEYLVKLMDNLRDRLVAAGIVLTMWHGPGAVASRVLADHEMGLHLGGDDRVKKVARSAYFGGRFEQFRVGLYDGKVYEYDIRSAYPASAVHLSSLDRVQWRHSKRVGKVDPYGVYHVRWHAPFGIVGPLPWRHSSGAIFYPSKGEGWYWGVEVGNLVRHCDPSWYDLVEGFTSYGMGKTLRPFEWVDDYYRKRAQLKRDGDPAQLAYKLALNSIYGKMAQSKGAELRPDGTWRLPRWHQLEWAGWITANTRATLYDAMIRAGDTLIAVETDALFTSAPIDGLTIGDRLGEWEESRFDGILYLQSGVYFVRDVHSAWSCKSRGFEPRHHTFERWLDYCRRCPNDEPGLSMSSHRFGTVMGSEHFGRWYDHHRTLRLDGLLTKRAHYGLMCKECVGHEGTYGDVMHHLVVPEPLVPVGDLSSAHSVPWARRDESLVFDDDDLTLDASLEWSV